MTSAGGVSIGARAFRVPQAYRTVHELGVQTSSGDDDLTALKIPKLRELTLAEVDGVHVFGAEPRGALARSAIDEVLRKERLEPARLGLLIDFSTTSRDENGLSLCYRLQAELGAQRAMTLALGNGSCAGFLLALITAKALMLSAPEQPDK